MADFKGYPGRRHPQTHPETNPGPWAEASRALSYRAVTGPYEQSRAHITYTMLTVDPAGPLKVAGPQGISSPCPPPPSRQACTSVQIPIAKCYMTDFNGYPWQGDNRPNTNSHITWRISRASQDREISDQIPIAVTWRISMATQDKEATVQIPIANRLYFIGYKVRGEKRFYILDSNTRVDFKGYHASTGRQPEFEGCSSVVGIFWNASFQWAMYWWIEGMSICPRCLFKHRISLSYRLSVIGYRTVLTITH